MVQTILRRLISGRKSLKKSRENTGLVKNVWWCQYKLQSMNLDQQLIVPNNRATPATESLPHSSTATKTGMADEGADLYSFLMLQQQEYLSDERVPCTAVSSLAGIKSARRRQEARATRRRRALRHPWRPLLGSCPPRPATPA